MTNKRNIIVKRLPERLHLRGVQDLRKELDPILKSDQPSIVFDFAEVRQMDGAGVEMLIQCLDAAMSRDGDIKLAAVPNELLVILELTRVDRLFEIFETASAAVESFHRFAVPGMQLDANASPMNGKPNGHFKLVS